MQLHNSIVLLTNRCNCKCSYCFEERDAKQMSLDVAKDVLLYLHKYNGLPGFTFFGGEPILRWDDLIIPLFEFSKTLDKSTRFAMTTNGILLDKEKIDFLFDNEIHFMLSCDGNKDTQDYNRPLRNGKSSFDALEKNLLYVIEKNPNNPVRMTLIPDTIGDLYNNIRYFISIGATHIAMEPDLFQKWSNEQINVYLEQISLYEEYLRNSITDNKPYVIVHELTNAFASLLYLRNNQNRRTAKVCQSANQCGMGIRGSASTDVNGDFYGCHHISPLSRDSIWYIGNCYDGVDDKKVERLISLYDKDKIGNENCKACPLDAICNGGCCSNNYMIMGDVNKVPEMFCIHRRAWSDVAYRLIKEFGYGKFNHKI